jgi:serine/threonine-protein kinase
MQTPTEPAKSGFRVPLAIRIFLLFFVLIGLAVGAAVFVTYRQGQRIAEQAVRTAIDNSAEVQRELTQRRLEEVQLKAALIAEDQATVQYVSAAQGGGLGLGTDPIADARSISDILAERQESYAFDLGILLDTEGKVLARTDTSEAFDQSLAGDPFVEPVLRELSPVSGFWPQGERLYQAAILPLDQDSDLVGFLLIALQVDDDLAQRVGKASGADVAFLLPSGDGVVPIGSSLDAARRDTLQAAIAADSGGVRTAIRDAKPIERVNLTLAGENWIGRLAPLDPDGGSRIGSTLQLSSADKAAAGYRDVLNRLLLTGIGTLLVALPLSFLIAKATLRPLATMARAANDAAAGNYQTHIGIEGKDELAQLSHAFDRLLSDLREKSDIEGYVTNLSRFLPDPGQEPVMPSFVTQPGGGGAGSASAAARPATTTVEPPVRENMVLLGLDLRQFAKPLERETAEDAFTRLTERSSTVAGGARRYGGRLIAATGTRAVYGFSGEQRLLGALHAAREALAQDPTTAGALIEGEIVHGSVVAGDSATHAAVGPACFLLDRLLGESSAGNVLVPRTLGEAIKSGLGATVGVVNGAVTGKSYYGLGGSALGTLPTPPALPDDGYRAVAAAPPAPAAPRMTASGEIAPGARFGGRYEILSVLGSGGMGVVYKARDLELDDVVALKMLKASALMDREQLERLKSEIKLARKITHPNVLRTFDFGEVGGMPYISMEYVRGMTLRYLLRQAGRIPYSAALRIARQLSAGLAAAHEVGVLHRDIKPENLILEASGNAKLMDFGIARPIRRSEPGQTQPGMFVGTPHYSAPEQLAGDEVDHRADIFSSGVVLCEMFSGKLPFTGANTMEIYVAQMHAEPIKPSEHWPEMPKALEAVILKCIQRRPEDRYQSVAELGAALSTLRA